MSYEYKQHEIFARVWQSHSALYEIDKDGAITEEYEGCRIDHDDQYIVWYEFEAVDPESGFTTMFVENCKTLDDAKKVIDESIKYLRQFKD